MKVMINDEDDDDVAVVAAVVVVLVGLVAMGRKRVVVDGSLNSSPPPPKRPVERSSLQFRVLALKRFLPCIWRALPVVGSHNSDMGQGWCECVRSCVSFAEHRASMVRLFSYGFDS